ncbi:MAG: hypothetical protein K0R99_1013 [Microbacterium sp.]|jgi:hypothetical protein|uniref:hypothetical protein n=1 Tax=Microbacterium sp. TaxID=51671 RepID=UPI0026329028|nr:hypothetical protein [Microbacterium sp.]MDF2559567.1 hypothetical protein [Microbacterium sp.]
MPINLDAARRFLYDDARLLERHLAAVLFDDAPTEPVVTALRAYRNADGGWGHALEPDLRGPDSQVSAAMSALGILEQIDAHDDPMVTATADWLQSVSVSDGSVPHVLPTASAYPAAPWMQPSDEGFLTYRTAAHLWCLGVDHPWLTSATEWCWNQIETRELAGYEAVFALNFIDAVPESVRAEHAVERFRPSLRADGSIPIPGGVDGERVTALKLSPKPGTPSRALFADDIIEANLDALEREQLDDGGWDFDFLHWSPGQVVEWRGIVTLENLDTLRAHGRIAESTEILGKNSAPLRGK